MHTWIIGGGVGWGGGKTATTITKNHAENHHTHLDYEGGGGGGGQKDTTITKTHHAENHHTHLDYIYQGMGGGEQKQPPQ